VFGREKTKAPSAASISKIETIIGPNAHFRGDIQSDGGVRIDGVIEGTIDITGNLAILEGAKIIADIKANNISISGAVKGNISDIEPPMIEPPKPRPATEPASATIVDVEPTRQMDK
jgi:cytoskeletal protein CcmA (bactofilin family)